MNISKEDRELIEEWEYIDEQNYYQVSNLGRVRSLPRLLTHKNGKEVQLKGKILKPYLDRKGYLTITINHKTRPIHRLVAEHFIPNPNNKPCIDHINTNRVDNRVENLRWCTYKENMGNPITRKALIRHNQEISLNRREPIIREDLFGNIKEYDSITSAKLDGFNSGNISRCVRGLNSTHKGYKWYYKKDYENYNNN